MLTFRKGTGGPDSAAAMAQYLAEMPAESISIADYYLRGVARAELEGAAAVPRTDMRPELAAALGIDLTRTMRAEEVAALLQGLRADGTSIDGRQATAKVHGRDRITYFDFTFSAPKSVSVAMALAPTMQERHIIVGAHRDAVQSAMEHLESIVGYTRRGAGGSQGRVPGAMAWITFDHYTARPAVEIPHREADGSPSTVVLSVNNPDVSADMQLHSHVVTPNIVYAQDGKLGAMDTLALHDRVLEVGAYYQAHLATNLRSVGVDVALDSVKGAAMLPAVPEPVVTVFSKRHHEGEDAARNYVRDQGLDWDTLSPAGKVTVLRYGSGRARRGKDEATTPKGSDFARWRAEAERAGYTHETVIRPRADRAEALPKPERLLAAYQASLGLLDRQFQHRAVLKSTAARTAAAQGLIATGVSDSSEIAEITELMRLHGVQHDGKLVPVVWGDIPGTGEGSVNERMRGVRITTTRHIEMEQETMELLSRAAGDRSGALTPAEIARAVRTVAVRDGLDFDSEHGREQRRIMHALGTGGRVSAAVGVGGSGKTTMLRPLVEAWHAQGRQVIGTAIAWRQSSPLADAGIPEHRAMATARLRSMVEQGRITLDRNTVIVVDELSQVGTGFALQLAKWQLQDGFTLVAIGDDKQAQAIEAGSSIALIRRALGTVPEITSSVRQLRERDRETALMFREGRAADAIERLREDGHAILVPGGRRQAIEEVAALWERRRDAGRDRPDFKLTISAPTNYDARGIGAVIRARRRALGEVGPDRRVVQAVDQNGARYELPLAVGDRVRLFRRTYASAGPRSVHIGENGSVLDVLDIGAGGLTLRNERGARGFVPWEGLADKRSGRTLLSYGDVISIDAIQSATSTEHINALPSGSFATEGFRAYVAQSRAREVSWLVVPDGLERTEIAAKRAQGSAVPITEADVWANVAANLSRQPEKELATSMLAEATRVFHGELRPLAAAFQARAQRQSEGRPEPNGFREQREEREVREAAPGVARATDAATKSTTRAIGHSAAEMRRAAREARRSVRPPGSRPKKRERSMPITETEAREQFADALHRAGLIVKGGPVMDGRFHRAPVEGDKRGRLSGSYVGHMDNHPAGYIHNFKTGEQLLWRAAHPVQPMQPEERAAWQAKVAAEREAREAMREKGEAAAAERARAVWRKAGPAGSGHPYLARKGVQPHGARITRRGELLVPMQDAEGAIWGLQTISPDGRKLYGKGARKVGLFAALGDAGDGQVIIAEGFATGATLREATGLPVVVAFDAGNLLSVAEALREQSPNRQIILAADNDHHLPRREPALPNVGLEKAQQAAEAVGGLLLAPAFAPGDSGTDFNDLAAQDGLAAVRQAFVARGVEVRGWTRPAMDQAARDAARERGLGHRGAGKGVGGPTPPGASPEREPPTAGL